MKPIFTDYLSKYDGRVQELFSHVYRIAKNACPDAEERLWAGLPSLYHQDKFIRIIAFKDHINIEAKGFVEHKNKLPNYRFTPKDMLQIFVGQEVPDGFLIEAFKDTLISR